MRAFDELLRPLVSWNELLTPWAELMADLMVAATVTFVCCGLVFLVATGITMTLDLRVACKYILIVGPISASLLLFGVYVTWVVVGWWGFVYSAAYLGVTGWGIKVFLVNRGEEEGSPGARLFW